jgi:hypothetical protein
MNIKLSPEHAALIAKYAALTGYTQEEFASMFLADYFKQFDYGDDCGDESFLQETIGAMYFKDRESAERVQAWLLERVSRNFHLNSIETRISNNADGTFDVRMSVPCFWDKSRRLTIA